MKALANMMINSKIVGENYNKISQLGLGNFGSVWKVTRKDDPENRVIALKIVYLPNDKAVIEAEKEIDILKKLTPCNPSVVCYYGSKKTKTSEVGRPIIFIEMEYIEGETLTKFAEKYRVMRDVNLYKHLVAIAKDLGKGMKFLHDKGIIHRDIKPDNIMIDTSKSFPQPKLIDVGLGCFIQPTCVIPFSSISSTTSIISEKPSIPSFQEVQKRLREMKEATGNTVSPIQQTTQFRLDADIEDENSFSSDDSQNKDKELVKMYEVNDKGERVYYDCCKGRSGTANFSSPEVLLENIAYPSSDVWSLGASLHYSAAGKPLYEAQTMKQLLDKLKFDPVPIKTPNRVFNRLLRSCLQRNANFRITDEEIINFN